MARETYVYDKETGKVVAKSELYATHNRAAGPYVISDNLPDILSHADGKRYSSKRAYRAELKRRGYIEVGNEKTEPRRYVDNSLEIRRDIGQAYQQLVNGYRPEPLQHAKRGDVTWDL